MSMNFSCWEKASTVPQEKYSIKYGLHISYSTKKKLHIWFKKKKVARRLKLRNMPAFSTISGGTAIEMLATQGDATAFDYGNQPMCKYNDW